MVADDASAGAARGPRAHEGSALAQAVPQREALRTRARRCAAGERAATLKTGTAGWYVIQVPTGREEALRRDIERAAGSTDLGEPVLEEAFCPGYATQKKVRGEWRPHTAPLCPGYLIAVTRHVEVLKQRLLRVAGFTRLLSMGGGFTKLAAGERAWIQEYTQRGNRVMPMSMGVIEEFEAGDRVRVTSGPLLGHEAWISRIDRKRSIAYIELEMFGRRKETRVGLGVVRRQACRESDLITE